MAGGMLKKKGNEELFFTGLELCSRCADGLNPRDPLQKYAFTVVDPRRLHLMKPDGSCDCNIHYMEWRRQLAASASATTELSIEPMPC